MIKTVLVTGANGYIGSHMCKLLLKKGVQVVAIDNHSTSPKKWVHNYGERHSFDIRETERLVELLEKKEVDLALHFAGRALVGESQTNPLLYFSENLSAGISLLAALEAARVDKLVFSSTCATYGPYNEPISENFSQNPVNSYGLSKKLFEDLLRDLAQKNRLQVIALRYFNVAGCDPEGELGENHEPETHLIPNLCRSIINGQSEIFKIFGNKFNTPDGTAVRDYIHVQDLVSYHFEAVEKLLKRDKKESAFRAYNLGLGVGCSVNDVALAFEKTLNKKLIKSVSPPRDGDPAFLVADNRKSVSEFSFKPRYDLNDMILHTFHYLEKHL